MKDKTRITAMICIESYGWRVPIGIIGKSNNPRCFNFLDPGLQPTLCYQWQNNVWFDKEVMQ